ncbi:hypothetical protein SY212_02710 [Ligilactobacillus agilis]|uniref:Uncharacterized protein n=1 Tax=Ligilactobacillus agilis TaxID=1601 RepID=A0A6F9XIZ8_9LACO|nr:hypothetical protein [Ligilactobacillus agilis]GET05241.1 hypothetical protein SY212_02710 [Ligilactobacillus agilis]
MDLEIYLHRKDSLCSVLGKEIFEVECNDMVFGDVHLEDHIFDADDYIDWYKTVRFVRFDGEIFKRTIEKGSKYAWRGRGGSEDVAEELVTENLTEFFKEIRSKIKVEDTMGSTDTKRYDVSKHISVRFLDLHLEKRKEDWWYELKDYDTGVTRQISDGVFEFFDKEEGFIKKIPTTDEELIDGIFEDILQLVLFNQGKILPDNTKRSRMIKKGLKWAKANLESDQLYEAVEFLKKWE